MIRALFAATLVLFSLAACDNAAAPSGEVDMAPDAPPAAPDGPGVGVDSNGLRLSANAEAPSAAYLVLRGDGHSMTLVSVSSPEATRIEMHESVRENDMVSMRPVERIDIAPDGEVVMRPGGIHLMIFGISEMARAAQEVPLRLNFADGTVVTVNASVADLTARESGAPPDHVVDHSGH